MKFYGTSLEKYIREFGVVAIGKFYLAVSAVTKNGPCVILLKLVLKHGFASVKQFIQKGAG
jgi:hypothetical protein